MLSVDLSHPTLEGLRFFAYPVSGYIKDSRRGGWYDIAGRHVSRDDLGVNFTFIRGAGGGAHPMIRCGGGAGSQDGSQWFRYWRQIWPIDLSNDLTVIIKVRPYIVGGGGSIISAQNSGSTLNGGFRLRISSGGGFNGFGFGIAGGGSEFTLEDGTGFAPLLGKLIVLAATYDSREKRLSLYNNGKRVATSVNTAQTWTPHVAENDNLRIGAAREGSSAYWGDIGWAAIYNRVLSVGEMIEWQADDEWEWAYDEALEANAAVTFTTTVGVSTEFSVTGGGGVEYSSGVQCSCVIDGDLIAGPAPGATATYTTTVGVRNTMYGAEPTLVRYTTTVSASSVYAPSAPVTYTTTVYISTHARSLVDGRADLIGTARYRR